MPRKIRQLVVELETTGFVRVGGGKGSHRKFRHARFAGAVILSGKDGDDAHHNKSATPSKRPDDE
jgi:predicted RNA binding protein YcfA (HicA-like mRNA interferase family)